MDTLQKLMFLHRVKSASGGSVSWETISGTLPLTLLDAAAKPIKSLIRYGKVTQDGTPTPSAPVDIVCNNGVVRMVDDELPNGYKRLVGITFDGNLRYETGEALTGSDDVTMTLNNISPSGKNVFGSYNGTNNVNFSLYIYGSTTGSYFRYGDQLKRPKYGNTGRRTITFGKSGTSGFADDSEVTPDEFTTPTNTYIGMLPNSSSAAFTGDIIGSILVGNRLEWIPCERELDGVIGYYEKYNSNFLEPVGSGTPVSLGYDTSHLIVLTVVGTPEELTVGQFDTISGSIASFTPDATVPTVRGLTVDVEPVQDLHGYDAPWPAGGGKNKFNGTFLQGYWAYADGTWANSPNWITTEKIPCKASTSYTVSADAKITRWQGFVWYDSNGNFISTDNLPSNVNIGLTKTSPSTAAYLIFNIAGYPNTTDTIAPSDVTHFQLEEGSSSTAYAPYSNICPISGWTGAKVTRTGVNVWDGVIESGYIDINTGEERANPNQQRSLFVPCKPSTNYAYVNTNAVSGVRIAFYDGAKNYAGTFSNGNNNPQVFTTPANAKYLRFYWGDTSGISINYPSTDHEYHAYTGSVIPVSFGDAGTVYGGTLDVVNGKMTVDRAYYTWQSGGYLTTTKAFAIFKADVININAQNQTTFIGAICDKLKGATWADIANIPTEYSAGCVYGNGLAIRIPDFTTAEEYTAWLAENTPSFCYLLNTPITIDLTPLEISVLTGQTNNIWADSGDVSVELGKNVQTASVANLYAVDDYHDEQDLISGVVTRRVGVKVLTGTENWSYYQTSGGVSQFKLTRRIMEQRLSKKSPVVCSHYDAQLVDADGVAYLQSAFGEAYLYICDNRYTSEADFKAHIADQYAAGTPVIVMYQLAEEVTESVTPQQLTTIEGTNTVSTVANVGGLDGSCEYAFKSSGSIVGTAIVGTAVVG